MMGHDVADDGVVRFSDSALSSEGGSPVVDHRWSDDGSSVHEAALGFELESSGLRVRRMQPGDLNAAADICFTAFNSFNATVGLDPEFPPREPVDVPYTLYAPGAEGGENGFAGFVCVDGSDSIVGANLLDFRDGVGGIGPICSVAFGAGKLLMKAVMKEAAERGVRAVRLLQVAQSARSFSLYLSLGFEPRRVNLEYQGKCTAPPPAGDAAPPCTHLPSTSPRTQPCRHAAHAAPPRPLAALPRRAAPPRSPAALTCRHPSRPQASGSRRSPPAMLRPAPTSTALSAALRAQRRSPPPPPGRCRLPWRALWKVRPAPSHAAPQGWPYDWVPLEARSFPLSVGALLGYSTGAFMGGHAVAQSEEVYCALAVALSEAVAAGQERGEPLPPPTLFVPQQYSRLARWLAANGLRLVRQLPSMSYGPHPEPRAGGYYFPSISY